jgi:FKBP-type peptidyl-prolyl cis-trans isomerase FkpA
MNKLFLTLLPAFMLFLFACNSGANYKTTDSGLTYKFHKTNKGAKPLIDDVVKIDMAYRFPEDSVIFRSSEYQSPVLLTILASEYKGDIYEGLRMMSINDSTSFKLDAHSFFTRTLRYGGLPDFMQQGDSIYVDIVLHEILNKTQFEAYQQQETQKYMEEQEKLAIQEENILDNYLQQNNINAQPEESGLIIMVEKAGRGPKPQAGQMIKVHYTGKLIDGTVFDSSVERGTPIEFTIGRGQVIRGWDEGLSKINVGSKATFIIPSYLAYGDQARGAHIKPFSTLIFDVELLEAK